MIDARRKEVYCAVYDMNLNEIQKTAAVILEENSFSELLSGNRIYFFGDGSAKFAEMMKNNSNAVFRDGNFVSATNMISLSEEKFAKGIFEDVAYFEPYYLKDFLSTTPKKLL